MPTLSRAFRLTLFSFIALSYASPVSAESFLNRGRDGWKEPEAEAAPVAKPAPKKAEEAVEIAAPSPATEPTEDSLESLEPVKKKKKKVKRVRRVASLSEGETVEEEVGAGRTRSRVRSRSAKIDSQSHLFRIGILSGISSLQSGGASSGTLLNIGLQADAQFKYWGLELDGFYGMGLGLDATGGSGSSLSTYGVMPTIKGQYTFRANEMKFTPKVGLGYGLFNITQSATSSAGNTSAKVGYGGVFAMAGIEAMLVRWFTLYGDFATSLSASGTSEGDIGTGPFSQSLTDVQFQRLRLGGNFLIGQNFLLGAQFYQRSYGMGGSTQPQSFVLGHLGLQF